MIFKVGDNVVYTGRYLKIPWVGKIIHITEDGWVAIKFNNAEPHQSTGKYCLHDCDNKDKEYKSLWFASRDKYTSLKDLQIVSESIINLEEE